MRGITADDLVAWIRSLRATGYALHSFHNYWGPLHLVLTHAVRNGVMAGSPADQLTSSGRPKPGSGRRRSLNREDITKLPGAAPDRYRLAIACGLFSGLRLSELLGLTWSDIDFRAQVIRLRRQMGRDGKHRPPRGLRSRRGGLGPPLLAGQGEASRAASCTS